MGVLLKLKEAECNGVALCVACLAVTEMALVALISVVTGGFTYTCGIPFATLGFWLGKPWSVLLSSTACGEM